MQYSSVKNTMGKERLPHTDLGSNQIKKISSMVTFAVPLRFMIMNRNVTNAYIKGQTLEEPSS